MAGVASDGVLPGSPDIYRYLRAREPAELPDASDYIETVAKQRPFVVGLVQARMGSTRLPGKVLLPLPKEGGMPVLWHDFQRLKACKNVDQWVLATSTWHTDTVLEEFCTEHGIACFRGSESDCLERLFTGAVAHGAKEGDYVLRITSDCPLIDAGLVDRAVEEAVAGGYDQYGLWDQVPRSTRYADGLDCQVFSFTGMERMNREAKEPHEREHVGPFMMDHPDRFRLGHLDFPYEKGKNRNWTLENPRDYDFVSEVYQRLWRGKDATPFSIDDLIALLDREPALSDINHTPAELQNEGLFKSFRSKIKAHGGGDYHARRLTNFAKSSQLRGTRAHVPVQPVLARGDGAFVYDVDGNEYIDVAMRGGAVAFGHLYDFREAKAQGPLTPAAASAPGEAPGAATIEATAALRRLFAKPHVFYASSLAGARRVVAGLAGDRAVLERIDDLDHGLAARAPAGAARVLFEDRAAGRLAFPAVSSVQGIDCDAIVLGPTFANGETFFPVLWRTRDEGIRRAAGDCAEWDGDRASPHDVNRAAAAVLRAIEYHQKHFVVFNLHRFYTSLRSGLISGIMGNGMEDKVVLREGGGRIQIALAEGAGDPHAFAETIWAEMLARGIHITKDLYVTPCFAYETEIIVRMTLAFDAALVVYKFN